MRAPLTPQDRLAVPGLRPAALGDAPALARLLLAAYRGTIDEEEDTEAEAALEIEKTFSGEYGEFLPACSMVVPSGTGLASATLITRLTQRPFVAFTMSAPDHKRSGLARACLVAAMETLRSGGDTELWLVVTLANTPAMRLYESLGFVLAE